MIVMHDDCQLMQVICHWEIALTTVKLLAEFMQGIQLYKRLVKMF